CKRSSAPAAREDRSPRGPSGPRPGSTPPVPAERGAVRDGRVVDVVDRRTVVDGAVVVDDVDVDVDDVVVLVDEVGGVVVVVVVSADWVAAMGTACSTTVRLAVDPPASATHAPP